MSDGRVLVIGRISKPRGLHGHVFVTPLTNVDGRFEGLKEIVIEREDDVNKGYRVESVAWHGKYVVVKLAGIDDRNAAEALRGGFVSISHDTVPDLPGDTYYSYQLIGCTVKNTEDHVIGKIVDVEEYPASEVLKIASDNEYMLLPAVKQIVLDVDIERKLVVVDPPDDIPTYPLT